MSTFAVTAERLEILPHPNADALELAVVGGYRAVVGKDAYRSGEYALYIPEQAILPEPLIEELGLVGRLAGKDAQRVKAIRLRGELSQGIVCRPLALVDVDLAAAAAEGHDFAAELGISKWVPEIPANMAGEIEAAPSLISWIEIENIKRYPEMFAPEEIVVASEKAHGCLAGTVRVLMPDFTYERISHLVAADYRGMVMGMDAHGRIIPTPVKRTFQNGKTTEWLHIMCDRRGIGRGSASGAVTATPNHRFWSPGHPLVDREGYVRADQLRVGDEVWLHRSEVSLTPLAEQVLIGKMLGDGSLVNRSPRSTAVAFGHAAKHEAYLDWTTAMLGELCVAPTDRRFSSGYGTKMVRTHTVASSLIWDLFEDWVSSGVKQVPEKAVEQIGPIALAFWYMDDGNLTFTRDQEDRAQFSTNAFDETSVDRLLRALAKFGIRGVKFQAAGWRIRLNADDAERLFLLVAPYIPPVMQYKLPERYRGGEAGFPRVFGAYKSLIKSQRITRVQATSSASSIYRVTDNPKGALRYDLQTGTGNFFANGMLVHNSATIMTLDLDEDRIFASSKGFAGRHQAIKEDTANLYWRALRLYDVEAKARIIAERLGVRRLGIFGEVYGAGVQDLTYGIVSRNTPGYAVFDMAVTDTQGRVVWLDQFAVRTLCEDTGLPMVPQLFCGPYDYVLLTELAEGQTVLGHGAHLREGLVVRPLSERSDPATGGRAIAKFLSAAYLTRKGNVTEYE